MRAKKILKEIVDFFLFSNIFIALCAVAQALLTYHLLNILPDYTILAFLFLSTLVIYNLSMLIGKPKYPLTSKFIRVRWIYSHFRLMVSITLIAALLIIPIGILYLSIQSQILMGFTGLIALAYNLPFLILNNKKIGLRNLPGIKLFLIAAVWAISVVMLPIIEGENLYHIQIPVTETFLLTAKRFLFIAAITVPFDIRDLFQDKLYELKTIPVILGAKKAHIFCLSLLILYFILLLLFSKAIDANVIGLTATLFITTYLIFKSNVKKDEYYYFLLLDGMMIVQYATVFFFAYISS